MAAAKTVNVGRPAWLAADDELLDELRRQVESGGPASRVRFGLTEASLERALSALLGGGGAAGGSAGAAAALDAVGGACAENAVPGSAGVAGAAGSADAAAALDAVGGAGAENAAPGSAGVAGAAGSAGAAAALRAEGGAGAANAAAALGAEGGAGAANAAGGSAGVPGATGSARAAAALRAVGTAGAAETLALASYARPCVATLERPESAFWARRLAIAQTALGVAASALARIEADARSGFRWAGSGWLVAPSVLVTTAEVARLVAPPARAVFADGARASVIDVETDPESGLAFLRIEGDALPAFVPVAKEPPVDPYVAVVGKPFQDSRAHGELEVIAYGAALDRVSIAPGRIAAMSERVAHDCAMPGNASGSVLLDLESGAAAGLHLGGLLAGTAIGAGAIRQAMDRLAIRVPEPAVDFAPAVRLTPGDYADRAGYDENFLGIRVPFPKPVADFKDDVQTYAGPNGKTMRTLPYTHFSVMMSKSRKLCFYTAVNIDGKKLRPLTRANDKWLFDPRMADGAQAGPKIYSDPAVDLGHMVRRLDPVWGDEFEKANNDTFHYTNACPQHKDLNRKTWNDLEDYLLKNTSSSRMKATVFTGPVLAKNDPAYRGIKLPQQFWKVAVMVTDAGKLHATAYILSQADMITGLSFALFGEFRTYQLPLVDLERMTQIDFGTLRKFDPKSKKEKAVTFSTAAAASTFTEINGPEDLVL